MSFHMNDNRILLKLITADVIDMTVFITINETDSMFVLRAIFFITASSPKKKKKTVSHIKTVRSVPLCMNQPTIEPWRLKKSLNSSKTFINPFNWNGINTNMKIMNVWFTHSDITNIGPTIIWIRSCIVSYKIGNVIIII